MLIGGDVLLISVLAGLLYPFIGTVFGSSFVFFMKRLKNESGILSALDSIAAGIMTAASFFSLISPAVEQAESAISLFSCSAGFFTGIISFILIDIFIKKKEKARIKSGELLIWAVTLHNIPEGMAVGVVYAGLLAGENSVSLAGALSLSIGIALQNIPEGAIISMPLKARGKSTFLSFFKGTVSGIAELSAGVLTLFFSYFVYGIMPFCLCFAAGAMIYVVLAELSSEFSAGKKRALCLFLFGAGFTVMMLLDTFLG